MKFTQTFTIEIPDSEVLGIINEEQDYNNLEPFDSFKEIPTELIGIVLDESPIFADIFYDQYVYRADQITFTQ